ncbi:facilitated trehalose transporter Tret1-like [Anthonomus grandis grandis]|uniref:facilitated trehalose transporter Tret1-like n=1 Tax=Anthonomus grandis grandis TaxID=2921223 RepID=UPI002165E5D3|nr:facilitated trehalose transporter Tret1-like [Anthonomus grandis grandis]
MKSGLIRQLVPQVVATFLGTLMAASDGMTYGWTSPMIPYFLSNQTHIEVTEKDTEWMESICLLGAATGLPFTILGVNYFGRKICMILSAVLGCCCWIALLTTNSLEVLLTARFFSGMAGDMCFVAAPMYIAEIANPSIRGFLSALIYLMMLVGILLVYSVGSLLPYVVVPSIGIGLTLCQVVFFPFMPETPYYLVYVGKKEEAKKSLIRLRGTDTNVDGEIMEIEKAVERQKTEKGRPQDLILIKSNRRALLIMLILNGMQHFVGISVILMNLHVILDEAGSVYLKSSTAAIIFAGIMLCSGTLASVIIDKFGRKKLLISSSILTGCILSTIAIYFHLKNLQYDVIFVSWIPAVSIMIYAATFKLGLGLVPIVVTAEIFPTTIKAIGMTLGDVIYVAASLISISAYTSMFHSYGMHAPFYLFTVCAFCACGFIYFFVPETKGKSLDEIQMMLKGMKPEEVRGEKQVKETVA